MNCVLQRAGGVIVIMQPQASGYLVVLSVEVEKAGGGL